MKKTGIRESKIDEVNLRLWNNRYGISKSGEKEIASNLSVAEKNQYSRGVAYAKLNMAAANFFQSKSEVALRYLTEAFQWFLNNKGEKGYARAILLKGNIFESFGDYEKTLSLWLEAYKVSREIKDIESEGEACSQLGLIFSRLSDF